VERYLELIPEPDVIMLDDVSHFPQLEAPKYVLEQALSYFRHGI
jgi:pimeloyl-ACP methyl ester carboxylesterase